MFPKILAIFSKARCRVNKSERSRGNIAADIIGKAGPTGPTAFANPFRVPSWRNMTRRVERGPSCLQPSQATIMMVLEIPPLRSVKTTTVSRVSSKSSCPRASSYSRTPDAGLADDSERHQRLPPHTQIALRSGENHKQPVY